MMPVECSSGDCRTEATWLVDLDSDGEHPYCDECAAALRRALFPARPLSVPTRDLEQLRNAEMVAECPGAPDPEPPWVERLRAENERLREALSDLYTAAQPYITEAAPGEEMNGLWCSRFDALSGASWRALEALAAGSRTESNP